MNNTVAARWNVVLIPIGVAMNLGIGLLVTAFKLPIFLDAIGTVLMTIVAGWRIGAAVGVLSFLLGGFANPVLPYFAGTQFCIAAVTGLIGSRGWFRTIPLVILSGIVIGYVAAIVSAPVIAIVFGGVTTSGESVVTAFFLATGKTLWSAIITTKIWTEPLDKVLQCLAAYSILRALPQRVRSEFRGRAGYLAENGL